MNAIEIKNVCKRYKRDMDFNLKDITLALPEGCVMGLIGENGAGKSTLMRLILGMLHADSGEISVLNCDVKTPSFTDIRNDLGVVFDKAFPDRFTAQNVNRIMKRAYRSWNEALFFDYLKNFNIDKKKSIQELSKGMRMKLIIVAALSHDARLLILDEPTSGLDPVARDEILDIINDFTMDEKRSVLISSHILSDLEKVCDYIAYMSNGRLLFCEEKDELLDKLAVVKCSRDELGNIERHKIIGVRETEFGAEALVYRDAVPEGMYCERAAIEDIMIFTAKGEKL